MFATIEELLGAPTVQIAAMNDEQLKEYLKDVCSLEPKALPTTLGSKVVDESEEPDDGNPIKLKRKKTSTGDKKKITYSNEQLDKLEKEFE